MAYGETLAVEADGLRKSYGATEALAGLSLAVPRGAVYGLLGPNGAGKTTCVGVLTTLVRADAGRALVAGCDVASEAPGVRARIGLVGQHAAVDEVLSGRQNLVLFGRLLHLGASRARARANELLARFGLEDAADRAVSGYSGGMRRRLDLAAGLIRTPEVLFLDEPTTGLDPRSRSEVWDAVRALATDGVTVLLTTQYLEEADRLADRVAVVRDGRVVAEGPPADLKDELSGDRIEVVLRERGDMAAAVALLERVSGGAAEIDEDALRVSAPVQDRMGALAAVVGALDAEDVSLRRPTLDEVFLELTR
jgi:ABC-2 type transport system ATP-binding protein